MKIRKIFIAAILSVAILISFSTVFAEDVIEDIDSAESIENALDDSISKDFLILEADTLHDDATTIGGNLEVKGIVEGDAVCIGGTFDVNGSVTGDLVLIGSAGKIGPLAHISGSYVNIGSSVEIDSNAVISGEKTNISIGALDKVIKMALLSKYGITDKAVHHPMKDILGFITGFIVIYLIALFIVLLINPHKRVESSLQGNPLMSFLSGILVQLLFVPAIVLLAISIIGIPFIPLFMIAVFAGLIFGAGVVIKTIGNWGLAKMNMENRHPALAVFAGLLLLSIIPLISLILEWFKVPYIEGLFGFLNFIQTYILLTYSFGAVFLSRFGTMVYIRKAKQINEVKEKVLIEIKENTEDKTE